MQQAGLEVTPNRACEHPPAVVCWVAQLSSDADEAKNFYGALFDWTFDNIASGGQPPFYVASLHGDRVAGITGPQDPALWISAVSVHDVDQARRLAEQAGGTAPGDSVDIATLGRFQRLHDPAGAEIHVVQPLVGHDLSHVDIPGALSMFALSVEDVSTVAPFYETLFGWRADDATAATAFRLPGYLGGGPILAGAHDVVAMAIPAEKGATAAWIPDFLVDDMDGTADSALARGGSVLPGPASTRPNHRTATLADPTGAVFTVSQHLHSRSLSLQLPLHPHLTHH